MQCPVCKTVNLVMSERQGIEIDYCPQCRGVWLDRGELDKIIDRSAAAPSAVPPQAAAPAYPNQQYPNQQYPNQPYPGQRPSSQGYHDPHRSDYYKKKKREGFLSDLFDFD